MVTDFTAFIIPPWRRSHFKEGEVSETMNEGELERMEEHYVDLIGFVPPRIRARLRLSGKVDPAHLRLQEAMRTHCMYPECFDVKTAQLMLFGLLLMVRADGARFHAIAARRAGASVEELHAIAAMAGLYGGLTVMNLAAELLSAILDSEETSVKPRP
jgi:alkylhydroperoxidase/carboxymuconolactone decarboxylase family protein YurZ